MGVKTITIKEKVYKDLIKVKSKDESFSDLFERLIEEKKPDLKSFFGVWKLTDVESANVKKGLDAFRKDFDDDWSRRLREILK